MGEEEAEKKNKTTKKSRKPLLKSIIIRPNKDIEDDPL